MESNRTREVVVSHLLWTSDTSDWVALFSDSSPAPFIVFIESAGPQKSLGSLDQLALVIKLMN